MRKLKYIFLAAVVASIFAAYAGVAIERWLALRHTFEEWQAPVKAQTAKSGLDAALVLAVIHVESRGNPAASSPKGAKGLMQIMPAAARDMAKKLNLEYSDRMLLDPDLNMRLGTAYLSWLLERYKGDARLALAAYNAGPSRVDEWRKKGEGLPSEALIEAYAFAETRAYVKDVLECAEKFRGMMGGK